jgi:hypothetical protein
MINYLLGGNVDCDRLKDMIEYAARGFLHFEESCQFIEIQSYLLWLQQIQKVMTDQNLLVWIKLNDFDKDATIDYEALGFGGHYNYIHLTYNMMELYYHEIFNIFHDNKMKLMPNKDFYYSAYYLIYNIDNRINPKSKSYMFSRSI